MFNTPFNKKPMQPPRPHGDGCKIKVRKSATGSTIEFQGNCSKEQLEMAKLRIGEDQEED